MGVIPKRQKEILWAVAFGHVRQIQGPLGKRWRSDFNGVDVSTVIHRLNVQRLITLPWNTFRWELTDLGRTYL